VPYQGYHGEIRALVGEQEGFNGPFIVKTRRIEASPLRLLPRAGGIRQPPPACTVRGDLIDYKTALRQSHAGLGFRVYVEYDPLLGPTRTGRNYDARRPNKTPILHSLAVRVSDRLLDREKPYLIVLVLITMIASNYMRVRWAVDIGRWDPAAPEVDFLLDLLPPADQDCVRAFKQAADVRRSLVSRLLTRFFFSRALGIPFSQIQIGRTKGRKPFLLTEDPDILTAKNTLNAPNLNMNVSHDGCFVVLISDPFLVCGIDVAAPHHARMKGRGPTCLAELRNAYQRCLSPSEWAQISIFDNFFDQLLCFQTIWSLKEAFVKARGDGVAFDLSRCTFTWRRRGEGEEEEGGGGAFQVPAPDDICCCIDGVPQSGWLFETQRLPQDHIVSVAKTSRLVLDVVDAVGTFKKSLLKPNLDPASSSSSSSSSLSPSSEPSPPPSFELLSVGDLVPEYLRERFEEVRGEYV